MDQERLQMLRKKRTTYLFVYMAIMVSVMAILSETIGTYTIIFLGMIGSLVTVFISWKQKTMPHLFMLFPKLNEEFKELRAYEQEKMGTEVKKMYRSTLISQIIVFASLLFQLLVNPMIYKIQFPLYTWPIFFIVMVTITLISQRSVNKKIDRGEDWTGYTRKNIIWSIVIAVIVTVILFWAVLFYVILTF